MKNIFKKMLAFCLVFALVFTVMGSVVSAEETLTATMGTLKGTHKFGYNIPIIFEEYAGATAWGADVAFTSGGESKSVTVDFEDGSAAKTVIGVSNISLNGIANEFTVTPWVKVGDSKISATPFTAKYIDWLLSKKDVVDAGRVEVIKTINDILDVYASIKGEAVYEGQDYTLEAAPEGIWTGANPGNTDVKGSFNTADGVNLFQTDLGFEYPESGYISTPVGENMVVNGDFSAGQEGWTTWSSNYSFENGEAASAGAYIWNIPAIEIEDNTDYRVTFKLRSDATDASAINFWFSIQNGAEADKFPFTGVIPAHSNFADQDFDACINNNTTTYYFDFNTGTTFDHATASKNDRLYIAFRNLSKTAWVYIDDVTFHKLEKQPVGPHDVINNGWDTDALYYEWVGKNLGFTGKVDAFDAVGSNAVYGANPFDGSVTWAWLPHSYSSNGTKINLKPNTYYTLSADVYVPDGKVIAFAISDTDAYNNVNNDKLVMKAEFDSVDGGWRQVSYNFYSGDYSGDFWLTIMHWGTATTATGNYARVRYDSVKISPVGAGAEVYKDGEMLANVTYEKDDTLAVSVSNIAFANLAQQYTIVPYAAEGTANVRGEELTASYADFLLHALKSDKATAVQKSQAYAICKIYKALYDVDLCTYQEHVNLVVNGSFEDGFEGWTSYKHSADQWGGVGVFHADGDKTDVLEATDGGYVGQIFAFKGSIYQNVKVEKNKTYKVSFDYRTGRYTYKAGTTDEAKKSLWSQFFLLPTAEPINEYPEAAGIDGDYLQGGLGDPLEWTHWEFEINSGDNEYIYICWYQTRDTRWGSYSIETIERSFLDNVKLIAQ